MGAGKNGRARIYFLAPATQTRMAAFWELFLGALTSLLLT